jgi:peroxiredoxin (alkyl hydroperoxide reductase subunit C)
LIDQKSIVRHQVVNDLTLGRSVTESIRMLEALQHVETYGEVCPADWNKKQPAITTSQESVGNYLSRKIA